MTEAQDHCYPTIDNCEVYAADGTCDTCKQYYDRTPLHDGCYIPIDACADQVKDKCHRCVDGYTKSTD